MPFTGMVKRKRKFFKSMQNKITKKYQFYFSFILEVILKKKKQKKEYTTQKHFNSEEKEKREGKRRKKIKGKDKETKVIN